MAKSSAHRFGQILGNLLEEILLPELQHFCEGRGLYLDRHGPRPGARAGKKVSWSDRFDNSHDLDFVIEKGGTASTRGRPVAFIEAAWRRYTKHSRNKVQEIQGAILPIAEKYAHDSPFLGVVLAGVFTSNSINQLRSQGFKVVYLPYTTIVAALKSVGIEAQFDEGTLDKVFAACSRKIEALSAAQHEKLKRSLMTANEAAFRDFFDALKQKLDRIIERVVVVPLFGSPLTFESVDAAASFIDKFEEKKFEGGNFQRYELTVVYSNGDEIRGSFSSKTRTKEFLKYVCA